MFIFNQSLSVNELVRVTFVFTFEVSVQRPAFTWMCILMTEEQVAIASTVLNQGRI